MLQVRTESSSLLFLARRPSAEFPLGASPNRCLPTPNARSRSRLHAESRILVGILGKVSFSNEGLAKPKPGRTQEQHAFAPVEPAVSPENFPTLALRRLAEGERRQAFPRELQRAVAKARIENPPLTQAGIGTVTDLRLFS
jgi:hypothetical protein